MIDAIYDEDPRVRMANEAIHIIDTMVEDFQSDILDQASNNLSVSLVVTSLGEIISRFGRRLDRYEQLLEHTNDPNLPSTNVIISKRFI